MCVCVVFVVVVVVIELLLRFVLKVGLYVMTRKAIYKRARARERAGVCM